ncbi:hypothetical protein FGB62_332g08 [Gracilaria domingensis]|nr:hypothetical protein FGB62_332g08 [Gracilaria domingensis]
MYIRQTLRSGEPLQQLRAFALREAASNKVDNFEELPVDGLKLYAHATCVQGPTIKHVKEAFHLQLRNIPEQARADIIDSAVVEGMDNVNTRQNTAADVAVSEKTFSYLAYWNTKFNGDQVLVPSDRYSTCIMGTDVDVKIGEQIAGYEESSGLVPIGTRPWERLLAAETLRAAEMWKCQAFHGKHRTKNASLEKIISGTHQIQMERIRDRSYECPTLRIANV